ncbi:hypothetical protein [Sphingomonas sp. LT1P40]|uniref:hypothetical protein n=1 Tax=Alteristakelama amylovorans TaxID=3096166 RepID=UPI002FCAC27D
MTAFGREPFSEPGTASADSGMVILDGPGGVAIAMTPDAAEVTARNLKAAADEARRQPQQMPPIPA